jgi:tetratricopeptide (TPR) repeat protein
LLKNIGKMSFELWKYQESIDYFDDYLRIFGENEQVWAYRGNAYYELGEYQKAYLSYKKSLRIQDNKIVKDNYNKALAQMKKE